MRKDVEYKLKGGRTYVAHYDCNSVCKVRKATLELLFKELDKSYEQAEILEKIKENYALFRAGSIQIPENATNGDMMKAMFPEVEVPHEDRATIHFFIENQVTEMTGCAMKEWWNAPYKADSEVE